MNKSKYVFKVSGETFFFIICKLYITCCFKKYINDF